MTLRMKLYILKDGIRPTQSYPTSRLGAGLPRTERSGGIQSLQFAVDIHSTRSGHDRSTDIELGPLDTDREYVQSK